MDAIKADVAVCFHDAVSIHAPVMDAMGFVTAQYAAKPCFNPRARDGRD